VSAVAHAAGAPPAGARKPLLLRPAGVWAVRVTTFVLLMAVWEVAAADVNRALFAPPSEVAASLIDIALVKGTIWGPLFDSLRTLFIGLALCIAVGVPLGLAMGRSQTIQFVLDPYVTFLYVLPNVAFIPVLVVWLGLGLEMRVALVFLSGVFPMTINTMIGARHVDSEFIDGGRSFSASSWQIMRTIVVPASLPFMFAGLRIAFSAAWVGVIVAEMTALITGVGGMILRFSNFFQTANVLVPILFIMFVGITIQWSTALLQRRLTPWHRDARDELG
jgi:ABC-type nitrate/sulfonate/bicarbonate transport system permease component